MNAADAGVREIVPEAPEPTFRERLEAEVSGRRRELMEAVDVLEAHREFLFELEAAESRHGPLTAEEFFATTRQDELTRARVAALLTRVGIRQEET